MRRTERRPGGERRTITVRGDTVRIDGADGTTRHGLAQAPTLALLMDVLGALAAGDTQHLRDALDARLAGSWQDWRIGLAAPLPPAVPGRRTRRAEHAGLTLAGAGGRLRSIAIDSPRSGRIEIRFITGAAR
ncbi:MAG: LolA-related protein [Halofilum sp. (in: g-proteobacteria)]|nr:LolA-related protein [Halofilum sp. (in: g-proteobacteria)]